MPQSELSLQRVNECQRHLHHQLETDQPHHFMMRKTLKKVESGCSLSLMSEQNNTAACAGKHLAVVVQYQKYGVLEVAVLVCAAAAADFQETQVRIRVSASVYKEDAVSQVVQDLPAATQMPYALEAARNLPQFAGLAAALMAVSVLKVVEAVQVFVQLVQVFSVAFSFLDIAVH